MTKDEELKYAREWYNEAERYEFYPSIPEMLIAYHRHRLETAWVSVKERLPEPLKQVLAIVKHEHGTAIVMAEYVPPKTVLAEDFVNEECGEGLDEYDEEKDCYWTKEGWFEWQHEAEIHYLIWDDVIYWQPLPEPPKEALNSDYVLRHNPDGSTDMEEIKK